MPPLYLWSIYALKPEKAFSNWAYRYIFPAWGQSGCGCEILKASCDQGRCIDYVLLRTLWYSLTAQDASWCSEWAEADQLNIQSSPLYSYFAGTAFEWCGFPKLWCFCIVETGFFLLLMELCFEWHGGYCSRKIDLSNFSVKSRLWLFSFVGSPV